jgi:hypothetical protein
MLLGDDEVGIANSSSPPTPSAALTNIATGMCEVSVEVRTSRVIVM